MSNLNPLGDMVDFSLLEDTPDEKEVTKVEDAPKPDETTAKPDTEPGTVEKTDTETAPAEVVVEPDKSESSPAVDPYDEEFKAHGLDAKYKSPREVFRAHANLQTYAGQLAREQEIANREMRAMRAELDRLKPPAEESNEAFLTKFQENPLNALREAGVVTKEELDKSLNSVVQIAQRVAVEREIDSFKATHPDYAQMEPAMMRIAEEKPYLLQGPQSMVMQDLYDLAKLRNPVKPAGEKKPVTPTSSPSAKNAAQTAPTKPTAPIAKPVDENKPNTVADVWDDEKDKKSFTASMFT